MSDDGCQTLHFSATVVSLVKYQIRIIRIVPPFGTKQKEGRAPHSGVGVLLAVPGYVNVTRQCLYPEG